jgi:hypothetical protein
LEGLEECLFSLLKVVNFVAEVAEIARVDFVAGDLLDERKEIVQGSDGRESRRVGIFAVEAAGGAEYEGVFDDVERRAEVIELGSE